jgi:hypothetical protein
VKRLVTSLSRLLHPAAALAATAPAGLAFTSSRPLGGTVVLDHLWRWLWIDAAMARLLAGRVLFALVANRALDPSIEDGRRRLGEPPRAHRRPPRGQ